MSGLRRRAAEEEHEQLVLDEDGAEVDRLERPHPGSDLA